MNKSMYFKDSQILRKNCFIVHKEWHSDWKDKNEQKKMDHKELKNTIFSYFHSIQSLFTCMEAFCGRSKSRKCFKGYCGRNAEFITISQSHGEHIISNIFIPVQTFMIVKVIQSNIPVQILKDSEFNTNKDSKRPVIRSWHQFFVIDKKHVTLLFKDKW